MNPLLALRAQTGEHSMQLGFVSAILPDLDFEQVLDVAKAIGYRTVEIMCWPVGKSDRRYAGVTHIDVAEITSTKANDLREKADERGISISGLGYYPNPLAADSSERELYVGHLRKVIQAAKLLDLSIVNTFIGRDPKLSVDDNWPGFMKVWPDLVKFADDHGIKIAIENCPMIFSNNEWPGGKNLASSPAVWRRMFEAIPSANFGLNLDPSHLTWLMIDPSPVIKEFAARIHHVHAKDARIDHEKLQEVGVMGLDWHTPKLPGMGDVDWTRFFGSLTDIGYKGAVCVEVEDRAFEKSLEDRKRALAISKNYLRQFFG
jgi:sugar phosphate isomerase/epimerase